MDREDDDFFIRVINEPEDLHLIVAGGEGPLGAVMPGWNGRAAPFTGRIAPVAAAPPVPARGRRLTSALLQSPRARAPG